MIRGGFGLQRGDTIVEVLIAMSILGLTLASAYGLANRAAIANQTARDRTQATLLLQEQTEGVRWLRDTYQDDWDGLLNVLNFSEDEADSTPDPFYMTIDDSTNPAEWVINEAAPNIETCLNETNKADSSLCLFENFYTVHVDPTRAADDTSISFNIRIIWDRLGGGRDETSSVLRLANLEKAGVTILNVTGEGGGGSVGSGGGGGTTPDPCQPTTGTGNGLIGRYYEYDSSESQPSTSQFEFKFDRTDSNPLSNTYWGYNVSPGGGISDDHFAVIWEGQLEAPVSGIYDFEIRADDGIRIYIGDTTIIDEWGPRSWTAGYYSGGDTSTVSLVQGQKYPIRIELYEITGEAGVDMLWKNTTSSCDFAPDYEPISNEYLYATKTYSALSCKVHSGRFELPLMYEDPDDADADGTINVFASAGGNAYRVKNFTPPDGNYQGIKFIMRGYEDDSTMNVQVNGKNTGSFEVEDSDEYSTYTVESDISDGQGITIEMDTNSDAEYTFLDYAILVGESSNLATTAGCD